MYPEAQIPISSSPFSSDVVQRKMELPLNSNSASLSWLCFGYGVVSSAGPQPHQMRNTLGVLYPVTCVQGEETIKSARQYPHSINWSRVGSSMKIKGFIGGEPTSPWFIPGGSFLAMEFWGKYTICFSPSFSGSPMCQFPSPSWLRQALFQILTLVSRWG